MNFCATLQLVSAQKPKVQFSIRLPDDVIEGLDKMAAELGSLGTTRNNIVEHACAWYVRAWTAHGNRPITESDMRDLEDYLRTKIAGTRNVVEDTTEALKFAEGPGSISEPPVPGSSQAPIPVRYQGKKRKLSN